MKLCTTTSQTSEGNDVTISFPEVRTSLVQQTAFILMAIFDEELPLVATMLAVAMARRITVWDKPVRLLWSIGKVPVTSQ